MEQNNEDELEEDLENLEEEVKEEPNNVEQQAGQTKPRLPEKQVVSETYEIIGQPERYGLANMLTGEVIEGFDPEKDEATVKLGKLILNKLDKIALSLGV